MRILLFGATGRTGKLILHKALKDGHEVTAIVRDPAKLDGLNAKIIQGSPYDKETVNKAIVNCDVVISTLNVSRVTDSPWAKLRAPKDMISRSIQNALVPVSPGQKCLLFLDWLFLPVILNMLTKIIQGRKNYWLSLTVTGQ